MSVVDYLNAYPFYYAGVMSVRCDDCGADLMPGVDLTGQNEEPVQEAPCESEPDWFLGYETEVPNA